MSPPLFSTYLLTERPMTQMEKCNDCGRLALLGETVTIPTSEYQKLVTEARAGRSVTRLADYRALSRSGIGLNPELAEFILECAPTMTIKMIREACLERFGSKTPSRSSIHRFIDKMRMIRKL